MDNPPSLVTPLEKDLEGEKDLEPQAKKPSERKTALERRSWHYVLKPAEYEITCDKCGGTSIHWSEWKGMIWCYACKADTKGTGGIFDGPIPVTLCAILGIYFHIYHMRLDRVLYFHADKNQYWSFPEDASSRPAGASPEGSKSPRNPQDTHPETVEGETP